MKIISITIHLVALRLASSNNLNKDKIAMQNIYFILILRLAYNMYMRSLTDHRCYSTFVRHLLGIQFSEAPFIESDIIHR